MRTGLLITAAVAVVASTAAAANFDVNDADTKLDDLSSGDSTIADCTDGLTLDVLHSADYDDDINDWYVTGVRVAGDTTALLDGCTDMALSVAIDDGDTNLTELGPVVLTADSVTGGVIDLPVADDIDIPVRSATEVSAVVERNLDAIAALAPPLPPGPVSIKVMDAVALVPWDQTTDVGTFTIDLPYSFDAATHQAVLAAQPDGTGGIWVTDYLTVNGTSAPCSDHGGHRNSSYPEHWCWTYRSWMTPNIQPLSGGPMDVSDLIATGDNTFVVTKERNNGLYASDVWLYVTER